MIRTSSKKRHKKADDIENWDENTIAKCVFSDGEFACRKEATKNHERQRKSNN